jgi:mRNA-degrading endonuclease RelE of RelBE toxin-antitoxin system
MPAYQPAIHRSAQRELNELPDQDASRLTSTLTDIASTEAPSTHSKVQPMQGHSGLLRVRVGDARAVIELKKPELHVLHVGHRSSVYRIEDGELDGRRATA